jgi:hypothetical protein
MKLIFCLDDKGGMMFNKRRQSQDKELRKRILETLNGKPLIMSPYSSKQFVEGGNLIISDAPQSETKHGVYFVEDLPYFLSDVDEITVYKWNRHYPSDVKFGIDLSKEGFILDTVYEFEGSSHEKITEEKYKRGEV